MNLTVFRLMSSSYQKSPLVMPYRSVRLGGDKGCCRSVEDNSYVCYTVAV